MLDKRNRVTRIVTTRILRRSATRHRHALPTGDLRRGAASALTLACLCAAALSAAPVRAQTSANKSSTTSNAADWTSASSGWFYDSEDIAYGIPPVGNWKLQDQQWFTPGAAPANWTTFALQPKPAAAAWANAPSYNNDTTSTSAAGSTATSKWYINTYKSIAPINPFYYATYATKSLANAVAPDKTANSKTRILDPYVYTNPNTDPDGHWLISTQFALWGSVQNMPDGENAITAGYSYSPNSTDENLAQSLLDISIGGAQTTVVANSSLMSQGRLSILDSMGNSISLDQMINEIDAYRTSSGWSLSPDLDPALFRADDQSDLNQVLSFNMILRLDQTDAFDSLYTSHGSSAAASTPEPGTVSLLAGLSLSLTGVIVKRRRRR